MPTRYGRAMGAEALGSGLMGLAELIARLRDGDRNAGFQRDQQEAQRRADDVARLRWETQLAMTPGVQPIGKRESQAFGISEPPRDAPAPPVPALEMQEGTVRAPSGGGGPPRSPVSEPIVRVAPPDAPLAPERLTLEGKAKDRSLAIPEPVRGPQPPQVLPEGFRELPVGGFMYNPNAEEDAARAEAVAAGRIIVDNYRERVPAGIDTDEELAMLGRNELPLLPAPEPPRPMTPTERRMETKATRAQVLDAATGNAITWIRAGVPRNQALQFIRTSHNLLPGDATLVYEAALKVTQQSAAREDIVVGGRSFPNTPEGQAYAAAWREQLFGGSDNPFLVELNRMLGDSAQATQASTPQVAVPDAGSHPQDIVVGGRSFPNTPEGRREQLSGGSDNPFLVELSRMLGDSAQATQGSHPQDPLEEQRVAYDRAAAQIRGDGSGRNPASILGPRP